MSHLEYFNYPGFGERSRKDVYYSQAVRVDNRIEISGQGGWDRLTEEISKDIGQEVDQAFDNVEHALQNAGGKGWSQVYKFRIYAAPNTATSFGQIAVHVVQNLKQRFPTHGPLMTLVEVKGLYNDMRIEIEAEAHLG